ncbi:uncharacterized protein TNCV_3979671 [Trichonephila clavipes]|nr:uncharacterized protein TNCV_3979671 [Trichonephila clavipes]
MPVLRGTGASLDIGFEKCTAPETFTGNEIQNRRQRRNEAEKSTRIGNEDDQFRWRGYVAENGEDFVPSFTGEDMDKRNFVKLRDCEVVQAHLRNFVKLSNCEVMEGQLRNDETAPFVTSYASFL